jgi:hypothetical protein
MHSALVGSLLEQRKHLLNPLAPVPMQQIVERIKPLVQFCRIKVSSGIDACGLRDVFSHG